MSQRHVTGIEAVILVGVNQHKSALRYSSYVPLDFEFSTKLGNSMANDV